MIYDLSICVPTHNGRLDNLKNALDSVITQIDDTIKDKVEICISDNASEDGTKEFVEQFKQLHPNITYFRWDKNMGADYNFLKAVEIAKGKYCWLLGSDDFFSNGALKKILSEISSEHDVYIFNRAEYDTEMNFLYNSKPLIKRNIKTDVFYFNNAKDIESYFDSANSLDAAFGYLSCQIFLKKTWDDVSFDRDFLGTAYSMAFILLSVLKKNSSIKYIDSIFINCITGQDIWSENGLRRRILIDLKGYKMLFARIFNGLIDIQYYLKHTLHLSYGIKHCLYIKTSKDAKLIENDFIEIAGYSKMFFFFIGFLKYPYIALRKCKRLFNRIIQYAKI